MEGFKAAGAGFNVGVNCGGSLGLYIGPILIY